MRLTTVSFLFISVTLNARHVHPFQSVAIFTETFEWCCHQSHSLCVAHNVVSFFITIQLYGGSKLGCCAHSYLGSQSPTHGKFSFDFNLFLMKFVRQLIFSILTFDSLKNVWRCSRVWGHSNRMETLKRTFYFHCLHNSEMDVIYFPRCICNSFWQFNCRFLFTISDRIMHTQIKHMHICGRICRPQTIIKPKLDKI